MKRIDDFVNSIYKATDQHNKEVLELKEEMRQHLLETVYELQAEGLSEDASVKLAIERFGDVKQLTTGLSEFYQLKASVTKLLMRSSFIFLIIGVIFLASLLYRDYAYYKLPNQNMQSIKLILEENVNPLSGEGLQEIEGILQNTINIDALAIFNKADFSYDTELIPLSLLEPTKARYTYPDGEISTLPEWSTSVESKHWVIAYQQVKYNYMTLYFLPTSFLLVAVVLFLLSQVINPYYRRLQNGMK